jgi:cell division initiation protein
VTDRTSMDLTVEALRDARFREGWRGYNPADVDEFIDQISAGVQSLHDRIQELTLRAERAESRTVGESDDTVKRTLVLAQRAADLVVREAKSVSERIVADAHREAERITDDARVDAENRRHQVHADIDREGVERRSAVEVEIRAVQSRLTAEQEEAARERKVRQAELDEIQTHAQAARDRLRAALTDHLVRLDRLVDGTSTAPAPTAPAPTEPAAPLPGPTMFVAPVLAAPPTLVAAPVLAPPPAEIAPPAAAIAGSSDTALKSDVVSTSESSISQYVVGDASTDDFMS